MTNTKVQIYEVGGCVRDRLLDITPKDIDYVVVGANHQYMIDHGFSMFGKHFPVYLHSETKCEYALARRERKTGAGYTGFTCGVENVSLQEDLSRRDLTINAMAMDENQNIIDPYGGQKDIKDRVLRHVSDAFADDPLRIMRIAKFLSRGHGFSVHEQTRSMVMQMVANQAHTELSPQRVGRELYSLLESAQPTKGLVFLHEVGFFKHWWPWVHDNGIDQEFLDKIVADPQCDPKWRLPAVTYSQDASVVYLANSEIMVPAFNITSQDLIGIHRIKSLAFMLHNTSPVFKPSELNTTTVKLEENNAFHIPVRAERALSLLKNSKAIAERAQWAMQVMRIGLEYRRCGLAQVHTRDAIAHGIHGEPVSHLVSKKRIEYVQENFKLHEVS